MKNAMFYIKIMTFSIVFSMVVFATTYLSMRIFADQPSAGCLGCSYLKDIIFFSAFSLLTVPFILLIMRKAKINKMLFSVIISTIFILIVFINNFNVFRDRVSSWSSYSTKEEVLATIFQSYLYMITGGIIVFLIFYKVYKIETLK